MITSRWIYPGDELGDVLMIREKIFPGSGEQDLVDSCAWHLILDFDGRPAAYGRIIFLRPGSAQLDYLGVDEQYRNQGIGDGLLKVLIFKCDSMGLFRTELETTKDAMHRFERLGFVLQKPSFAFRGIQYYHMIREGEDGAVEACAHQ